MQSASVTHPGNVRKVNEDSILNERSNMWAVADGMGGYAAGDVASRLVIDALNRLDIPDSLENAANSIDAVLQAVNLKLSSEMTIGLGSDLMGSTVVVAASNGTQCACLWAGDSRLYVLRQNELYQISKDHSVVQEMIDEGVISREQAVDHPQSHVITRAIGVSSELELSKVVFDLQQGDVLLLCSDGLYNEVDPNELRSTLADTALNCELKVQALLGAALGTEAKDNISICVVQIPE